MHLSRLTTSSVGYDRGHRRRNDYRYERGVGGFVYLGASEKPQELILTLDADSYAKGIIGSGKTATVGGCYYWNGEK